jgi:hypothetical protein
VAEWTIAHALKACVAARLPWVRIPPLPLLLHRSLGEGEHYIRSRVGFRPPIRRGEVYPELNQRGSHPFRKQNISARHPEGPSPPANSPSLSLLTLSSTPSLFITPAICIRISLTQPLFENCHLIIKNICSLVLV